MRWQLAFLIPILLASGLAGCVDDAPEETEVTAKEGFAPVQLYVKSPLHLDHYPEIWKLEAVPRLVAFIAADNDTRLRLSEMDDDETTGPETAPGYADAANGWAGWNASDPDAGPYPEAAVQNWMRNGLWYEGEVPIGNYSVIRIELVDLDGSHTSGRELLIRANGDRISIGPPEGQNFEVRAGEENAFIATSLIERQGDDHYEIR